MKTTSIILVATQPHCSVEDGAGCVCLRVATVLAVAKPTMCVPIIPLIMESSVCVRVWHWPGMCKASDDVWCRGKHCGLDAGAGIACQLLMLMSPPRGMQLCAAWCVTLCILLYSIKCSGSQKDTTQMGSPGSCTCRAPNNAEVCLLFWLGGWSVTVALSADYYCVFAQLAGSTASMCLCMASFEAADLLTVSLMVCW